MPHRWFSRVSRSKSTSTGYGAVAENGGYGPTIR